MHDEEVLTAQIDNLLAAYDELVEGSGYDDFEDSEDESFELFVRLQAALDRLAPTSSVYANEAMSVVDWSIPDRIRTYARILRAMRADIEMGWLTTIEELLHAETYSDFLDMATELRNKGYKDPAAVLTGAVLESHLRALCARAGLPVDNDDGTPQRADRLNAGLRGADVYNLLQQKQITAWLDLRNKAAHGQFDEYDEAQVASFVSDVRNFLLKYPA